jgi:hypothetical protein
LRSPDVDEPAETGPQSSAESLVAACDAATELSIRACWSFEGKGVLRTVCILTKRPNKMTRCTKKFSVLHVKPSAVIIFAGCIDIRYYRSNFKDKFIHSVVLQCPHKMTRCAKKLSVLHVKPSVVIFARCLSALITGGHRSVNCSGDCLGECSG